ncbi:transcriptional regulator, ArgR family [Caminicella sporogenes DSM 14501]|uniref:Arginine repressor n=1 Tax=Caminicella sporogenes DSM 14501 TaxID=1121266 RepID=A0A1M6LL65_9FIRM|nr:arginine repressor [Caminicella sporogenes]RKD27870.1 arginine repressor [Caminicella sporogenes]WIF94548.1 arginine repressor [Caminicella sporogenes]SHJ71927.1 transcriptional regulator, ArgR family [Caminicella sporogenes DSM 14501]
MKYSRHAKILEIIENNEIETQEELAEYLKKNGFNVTQATVSRDIKELRLIKVLTKNGRYKYATIKQQEGVLSDRLIKIFKDSVLSIDYSKNIIVLKTLVGAANAAAAAIDALNIKEVVGTIAGDDTIFLLAREDKDVEELISYFKKLMK